MSEQILADVAMMYINLFPEFTADRLQFLINSLIDNVIPVLLYRTKKRLAHTDPGTVVMTHYDVVILTPINRYFTKILCLF